jgi:hypothetical protein
MQRKNQLLGYLGRLQSTRLGCRQVAGIGTRVSFTSCTGCSSMHRTGRAGSYGLAGNVVGASQLGLSSASATA